MQSGNHETYIRKYNYVDSLSCYETIKQDILTKVKENERRMIYLKKNVGFWQFGDIIFGCLCPTFVCQYCRHAHI